MAPRLERTACARGTLVNSVISYHLLARSATGLVNLGENASHHGVGGWLSSPAHVAGREREPPRFMLLASIEIKDFGQNSGWALAFKFEGVTIVSGQQRI